MRTFRGGAGPEINDLAAYDSTLPTNFAVVASPAPDQGTYRFEAIGTTAASLTLSVQPGFSLTFRWIVFVFQFKNPFMSGPQTTRFFFMGLTGGTGKRWLAANAVSTNTWRVQLIDDDESTVLASGPSSIPINSDVVIRIQTDGSRLKVWVDGGEPEIDEPETDILRGLTGQIKLENRTLTGSQKMYWDRIGTWDSNSETDRPGFSVARYKSVPSGEAVGEYGGKNDSNPENCGDTSKGLYANWNDWAGSGSHDDSKYNCKPAASNAREISDLSSPGSVASSANAGVTIYGRAQAASSVKTITTLMRIEDAGGAYQESFNLNIGPTSWANYAAAISTPPNGGAWTQAVLDALRAGVRGISTNGASDRWSAVAVEVCTVDDDPLSFSQRRPLGGSGQRSGDTQRR